MVIIIQHGLSRERIPKGCGVSVAGYKIPRVSVAAVRIEESDGSLADTTLSVKTTKE